MRVRCLQENLAKGLSIVGRAVSSRSTLPVLGNILLEARDNQLRLAATNLEIGINCWIGAEVSDEGSITIPAKLLADFVNTMPPEFIDMELSVRTQTLHLKSSSKDSDTKSKGFEANMKGIDANDFPIVPSMSTGQAALEGVTIDLEVFGLRKMIDTVTFAASTDESRPTLTGVEVSFKDGRLSMAATDGYRLSVRSAAVAGTLPPDAMTVIVPARSLDELSRISADADERQPVQLLVTQSRNQMIVQVWGKSNEGKGGGYHRVEMASQLIEARFPDYRSIIPKSVSTRTTVDTAAFLKAVRVASLFARDNANIVRVAVAPGNGSGTVRLTAMSSEMGDSANEVSAMVEGDALEIAFNAKYLTDVLSRVEQPQVVLETTTPTRPGAIKPVGTGPDETLHVVMPMHPPR